MPNVAPPSGTDLVFAAQAIVPAERSDRIAVAQMLRDAALADPQRRVVIKVRALAGENQTHPERDGYPDLIDGLGTAPRQSRRLGGPDGDRARLRRRSRDGVSSTAAIEAIARGIPVIALDTFGVSSSLINPVFVDSGLFGGRDAVLARDFRHPEPGWLDDNYFHDPDSADWASALDDLVAARRAGVLAARVALVPPGGWMRAAWDRKRAFGASDRSLGGLLALVVGVPARAFVRLRRRVKARVAAWLSSRRALSASVG